MSVEMEILGNIFVVHGHVLPAKCQILAGEYYSVVPYDITDDDGIKVAVLDVKSLAVIKCEDFKLLQPWKDGSIPPLKENFTMKYMYELIQKQNMSTWVLSEYNVLEVVRKVWDLSKMEDLLISEDDLTKYRRLHDARASNKSKAELSAVLKEYKKNIISKIRGSSIEHISTVYFDSKLEFDLLFNQFRKELTEEFREISNVGVIQGYEDTISALDSLKSEFEKNLSKIIDDAMKEYNLQ